MANEFVVDVELTDTFGGEANYTWVNRAEVTLPARAEDREIMRRAKAVVNLHGARGRWTSFGDEWHFRPYRRCIVLMARVRY